MNNRVKELINEKNDTFQCYLHSNKNSKLFNKVEYLQNELKSLIEANNEAKSDDSFNSAKTYWSILKSFLNNKKIHCIPRLIHQIRLNVSITFLLTNVL